MWDYIRSGVTFAADLSAVATAVVAVWLWMRFVWAARTRRKALEKYLLEEKVADEDEGLRSTLHLMSNLSMTEQEIFSAAFSSDKVTAVPITDRDGTIAKRIMFRYETPKPRKYFSR